MTETGSNRSQSCIVIIQTCFSRECQLSITIENRKRMGLGRPVALELSTRQLERSGSWQGQLQTSAEEAFLYTVLKLLEMFQDDTLQIYFLTYLLTYLTWLLNVETWSCNRILVGKLKLQWCNLCFSAYCAMRVHLCPLIHCVFMLLSCTALLRCWCKAPKNKNTYVQGGSKS